MEIIHRNTDYAVRALVALNAERRVMSASSLAERDGVPVDFLRKIMQLLKDAGIVESVRGPFGGYRLSRAPAGITLYEIIKAVQGPLCMNVCFADPKACKNSDSCGLRCRLADIGAELKSYLEKITLAQIAGDQPGGGNISH